MVIIQRMDKKYENTTYIMKTMAQKKRDSFVYQFDSSAIYSIKKLPQPLIEVIALPEIQNAKHHLQLSQSLALPTQPN